MALPSKKQKPPGTNVPGRSYADAAYNRLATTSHSLMHGDAENTSIGMSTANPSTNPQLRSIKTRIWRHARTANGYFLDIAKIPNMTDQQHLIILDKQYKANNFNGVKFLGRNNQRYIEIYPNETIAQRFMKEGVLYDSGNSKVQLFPCKAIHGQGKVIQVNLTDIPFIPKDRLLQDLSTVLGKFGNILDLGLHYEQSMGWYMGSGYAIIQQVPDKDYIKLTHTISWMTEHDQEFCYATFPDMPTWCRYCHEEGHTKFECQKALAHIMCYNCDRHGHKQVDCDKPKKGANSRPTKKARKTPPTPSDEAVKSGWAPGGIKDQESSKQQQQQQQQQQTQVTQEPSPDTPPKHTTPSQQGKGQAAETTKKRTQRSVSDEEMSDMEDDISYHPSENESESEDEDMDHSEVEADEVEGLIQDQNESTDNNTYGAGSDDSNIPPSSNAASPSNYNDSSPPTQNHL